MTSSDTLTTPPSRTLWLVAGIVLLLQGFSIFAPMVVLGLSIPVPFTLLTLPQTFPGCRRPC